MEDFDLEIGSYITVNALYKWKISKYTKLSENEINRFNLIFNNMFDLIETNKDPQDDGVHNNGADDNSTVMLVAIQKGRIYDSHGNDIHSTEMNEIECAEKNRVAGGLFNGSTPDSNFYVTTLNANGTANINNGTLTLETTTDSDSSVFIYTVDRARYIGGSMNQLRFVGRLNDLVTTNNVQMSGVTDDATLVNSIYYQLVNGVLSLVIKTEGEDDIEVVNGSFNGENKTIELNNDFATWEIIYTNKLIKFYINNSLIHTFTATDKPLCGGRHLRAFLKNENTGVGTATKLEIQVMTILSWSKAKTQPKYYLQEGLSTGVLLKNGIGSMHALNLSGVENTANITLYDGTSTAGVKIYTTGTMGPQTAPVSIPFNDGIIFQDGLYLTVTGADCNAMVIYE